MNLKVKKKKKTKIIEEHNNKEHACNAQDM
jgi:hypothetical protein